MRSLFSLAGKTALVTGGSRGIGLMIARGLLDAGAKVYISSRKQETCDAAARELSAFGTCLSLPADLSSEAEAKRLTGELATRESKLDILVNNAGATWGAPIETHPDAAFDKIHAVNVKAVFFLTRECLPLLEKAGTAADPSRIINIGSIDGIGLNTLDNFAYSASKAAVHQLTRQLAQRLGKRHVTVNAIAPGPFPSKMMASTLEEHGDRIRERAPLGRVGEPDDMAGAAVFLASRAGAYVTGHVLVVDGGLTLAGW